MDVLEYPSMSCELRGAMSQGHLKLTDEKIVFLHSKTGRKDTLVSGDIDIVNWQRIAGVWGIRIFTKDGQLHRFAGFKEAERDRVAKHFSTSFNIEMLDRELSVKGWNWGAANFNGSVLNFEVGKHDAFEIPLPYVSHCSTAKNEVTLEFSANDDAPVNLSELRFHIPSADLAGEEDHIEAFKEQIMSKANIVTATGGKDMASFREIHSLSPRGRYDIKFYPTFFHLHGKTFDYKIPVSTVIRLFLLPHKDQRQVFFCVNLDPPIKQGQTRYHYLVLSFMQDEETELELDISEEELQEKYEGKLEKEMKGPTFEIISKLMKVLCGRKVTVPGSFKGHTSTPAISCSYKAASGFVYPLERGFVFVYKPPIFIKYEDVRHVNFARSGGSNRSFDIEVHTRGDSAYIFSSIEKEEYHKLFDFLKSKKIKVNSTGKMDATSIKLGGDIDHNLEKVKADAESASENSSMSSDDEDFNPDALDALDAKEEYDSDPSDTGSDDDEALSGSDSETERKRQAKVEKSKQKAERKKTSKPSTGGDGTRTKKKKLTKLPGQPKKPMSAYFMWMMAEGREKIKEDNPGISVTEIGKKSGKGCGVA
jgi:structure-specific recognition protein 1